MVKGVRGSRPGTSSVTRICLRSGVTGSGTPTHSPTWRDHGPAADDGTGLDAPALGDDGGDPAASGRYAGDLAVRDKTRPEAARGGRIPKHHRLRRAVPVGGGECRGE